MKQSNQASFSKTPNLKTRLKFNWGTSIAIFYTSFVIIMILMVVKASHTEINMVQDNYYDQDLNYESFRKSRENGLNNLTTIELSDGNKEVVIQFELTNIQIKGDVKLYRPSDNRQDQNIPIQTNRLNTMRIPLQDISRGYWKIQVQWEVDGHHYYKEQSLLL